MFSKEIPLLKQYLQIHFLMIKQNTLDIKNDLKRILVFLDLYIILLNLLQKIFH